MFVKFAENLCKKLVENEFNIISNKFSDYELTEDREIIIMAKKIGPILYIVNIVNVDKVGVYYYEHHCEEYKKKFVDNIEEFNVEHVIMVGLLVTHDIGEKLSAYIDKEEFNPDEIFHLVHWVANLDTNKLITPKNHTNKILNIHNIIDSVLLEDMDGEAKNILLKDLEKEVNKSTALKAKTEDVYFTYNLIFINIVIWVIMLFNSNDMDISELIVKFGANSPQLVIVEGEYWRLFTSMFIHIGVAHLMCNCFAIYIFGTRVERYFGKKIFFGIYLISGLAGSIMSVLFSMSISAGASGAIYGLIGAISALTYQRNKKVDGLSFYMIAFIGITGLAFGFLDPQIGNYAHIGGLIIGYIMGFILCPEIETK